jgi:hypothetical protein
MKRLNLFICFLLWQVNQSDHELIPVGNLSGFIRTSLVRALCFTLVALTGCQQPVQPVSYEDLCGLTNEQIIPFADLSAVYYNEASRMQVF